MIDELKAYPKYKESGSKWIGKIPIHWDICSLGSLITKKNQRGRTDLPLLSVTREKGVIPRIMIGEDDNHNFIPDDLSNYKVVQKGNLAINKMKAWQGSMGIAPCDGIVSPAYYIFDIGVQNKIFAHLLLRSRPYVAHFAQISDGVRIGQWDLSISGMRRIPVIIPNEEEQKSIVKVLNSIIIKLNRMIGEKQNVISLLNEQRQTIINKIITRGLNPNVSMKPSHFPWIGDIPNSWEVLRAKYFFKEVDERSISGNEILLSVSHITGVTPRSEKKITMFKAKSYIGHKLCCANDLVINTMWAWMAALGVTKYDGIVSPSYAVYRPRNLNKFYGEYFDFLLRTKPFVSEYICRSTGIRSSRLRLYPEEFFKIPIIIPPLEEQQSIVEYIYSNTKDLNKSINANEKEITLLEELRVRLFSDVVTGKLDVKKLAERIPDSIENIEEIPGLYESIDREISQSETMSEAYG